VVFFVFLLDFGTAPTVVFFVTLFNLCVKEFEIYHTVGVVLKSNRKTKKYHTVEVVLKSNRKTKNTTLSG
jgi:hypothetical protein